MTKLPSGWHKISLDKVAYIQTGLAKGGNSIDDPITLPYIRVANVQDGYLDLSEIKYIDVDRSKADRYLLQVGDVLLTEGGDFDKLGRGTIWNGEVPNCLHQNHIFAVRLNQEDILPVFFALQASSHYGKQYFLSCAKRTTNLASINKSQLSEFPVLLPPLPEQRAIAQILGTWDAAIALVEQLIAALQTRKRGLMQKLLTGEVRFAGFEDEWQEVRLNETFDRITRTVSNDIENILSISSGKGFVDQGEKFGRVIAGKNLERYIHLLNGEFAYNKGNSNLYPQGCIYRLEEFHDGAVPNVYYCFKPLNDSVLGEFYRHYFESGMLNGKLRPLINSGVRNDGLLNLSADDFFSVEVDLPSPNEQHRLAVFFDLVSDEIRLQQQFWENLKTQKRGLMQRLLTGELRVQVES